MDRDRSAARVAAGAGDALAAGEREDAGVRRPSRDARDAARRAQRAGAARQRRLPRGAVGGAARHRGRAVPRRRRAEPPGVDRGGRRGAQLRVLPPPGALRPAVETVDGGAAHRTARSHRPSHPGRDRLLPSGVGHRRRRRAAVRAARAVPRADRRDSSRSSRTSSGALEEIALDPDASLSDAQIEQLIADAQAARTRIHEAAYQQLHRDPYRAELGPSILARVPDGPRRADGAGRRQRRRRGSASASSRCAAGAPTPSSSATRRSSTACPASRAGRRSSARSIASTRSRTRPSTSSPRATRSSKDCWRTSRRIRRDASRGSRCASRGRPASGWSPSTRTVPQFEVVAFDADGRARPDWADAFRRRPLAARQMKPEDAAAHDWAALVTRLAPQLGTRRPHAIAAVVVRSSPRPGWDGSAADSRR